MMRSMYSGVSGLRVHQTKMDVIGNNIANVNTVGFKASKVTFSDVFNQTIRGGSGPSEQSGRGGMNPMQIGLGSTVASIDMIMTDGSTQRTDNPLDLMIQGSGFFAVGDDAGGIRFTRAGAFKLDKAGNLVDPNGLKLHGWPAIDENNTGEYKIVPGKMQPINIADGDKSFALGKMTTNITFQGNLSTANSPINQNMSVYDSLGNTYSFNIKFNFIGVDGAGKNEWEAEIDSNVLMNGDKSLQINGAPLPKIKILYDKDGRLDQVGNTAGDKTTILDLTNITFAPPGTGVSSDFGAITMDFANTSQATGKTTLTKTENGNASGTITSWSVGSDGKITALYSNNDTRLLGQIALARFQNPAGLEKVGNNLFIPSSNSGEFDGVGVDPTVVGSIVGGALEMSNVDLSLEFTEMITTQRGFQANSRIITTTDDMLQELVNLKR